MKKIFLADSHTHILDSRLVERADDIALNLNNDGLAFIVEIGTGIEESKRNFEFAKRHENVYCTFGVHPHYASEYTDGIYCAQGIPPESTERYNKEFRELVINQVTLPQSRKKKSKVVAIGECGLDYHYDNCPRICQRDAFVSQIKLAHEVGLPLVIHSRDAFEDTFAILKEYKHNLQNGILFHCYGYGADEARQLINEFNPYFAFGGAVTFVDKKFCNDKKTGPLNSITKHICQNCLQEALEIIPLDRIILETDCPYLSPVPMRGKINEPKNLKYIAEFVARHLGLTFEHVACLTLENTKRFFRIDDNIAGTGSI